MSITSEYLNQISNSIEELQKAQITAVEATKAINIHNNDLNAHLNLFSGEDEQFLIARLSEQILVLTQRVQYLEEREIEHNSRLTLLESKIINLK